MAVTNNDNEITISKNKDLLKITLQNENFTAACPITERLIEKVEYTAFKKNSPHDRSISIVVQDRDDPLRKTIEAVESIVEDIEDLISFFQDE